MSDHLSPPVIADHPAEGRPVLRGLALWAVGAGVVVLAAAAFVLSYPGIHALALEAGVSARLARGYPVIFDAMLVIACAAVLSLLGAGVLSRSYAWLSLLVLLAAAGGADTLHAIGIHPPHRPAAAAAAIIPWALLLIGFSLLLVMLRHARLRRAAAAGRAAARAQPAPAMAALPAGTGSDQAEADRVILAAPAEAVVPQPRPQEPPFHRMWSTPTSPDDDDQG